MRHKYAQPGNPHALTINQHVFPVASIRRFVNAEGLVSVYRCNTRKAFSARPENNLFCAKHAWSHGAEHGYMLNIETQFQKLATRILREGVTAFTTDEQRQISLFWALWKLRAEVRACPTQDAHLGEVINYKLTADEGEVLEKNGYMFARSSTFSGRDLDSARIQILLSRQCRPDTSWAVVYSPIVEFLVPDSFGAVGIVPLSPNYCLVANAPTGQISPENTTEINELAIQMSTMYYFARCLKKCEA